MAIITENNNKNKMKEKKYKRNKRTGKRITALGSPNIDAANIKSRLSKKIEKGGIILI